MPKCGLFSGSPWGRREEKLWGKVRRGSNENSGSQNDTAWDFLFPDSGHSWLLSDGCPGNLFHWCCDVNRVVQLEGPTKILDSDCLTTSEVTKS